MVIVSYVGVDVIYELVGWHEFIQFSNKAVVKTKELP